MAATYYQVFVTPVKALGGVYDTEVDISQYVLADQIGSITRALDSTDYEVGIYAFSDVTLVCDASDGYLNDQTDSRSVFKFNRDLAKVRIVYNNGTQFTEFRGFINEEASRVDAENDTVSFVVMSHDSVLRKTKVAAGTVTNGMSFKNAIIAVLNSASTLLHTNSLNINPTYNGTVDDGTKFDSKSASVALNSLLLAANSVMTLDSSDNVYVKSRTESGNPILYLYGKGDIQGRCNVVTLSDYNTGLHRCFNSIRVKGGQPSTTVSGTTVSTPVPVVEVSNATSVGIYGLRQHEWTFDFITSPTTLQAIGNALLAEFAWPKPECMVTVPTELLIGQSPATDLLDRVSITSPLRVQASGPNLPIIGITKVGDTTAPLPYTEGAVAIDGSYIWKVLEVNENSQDFTASLKVRVKGTALNDGRT